MKGQMSIFEFLSQTADFASMPESEIMSEISRRTGVILVWDNHLEEYAAKVGNVRITAEISTYACTHEGSETVIKGHKFIGVGWQKSTEGGGKPCDSLDEAVEYILTALSRQKRRTGRKENRA